MKKLEQRDRVMYSEGLKINIGDYESYDLHLSYSTDVSQTETKEQALQRAVKFIKKSLDKRERIARKRSREFVDFDTMSKARGSYKK